MATTRTERDFLGPVELPAWAYWGASTQRAVENFPVSGYRFGRRFIRALGLLKYAAASANEELGRLDSALAEPIRQAAREVIDGKLDEHFVVDIFQTGSGTSTNMNANEVIARRAMELFGDRLVVHPNDHVNLGQSSNDVIPSAIHVAAVEALRHDLLPALRRLQDALEVKSREFWEIVKIARTHLMDATPIRLGQEFSGYAAQIGQARRRIEQAIAALHELPIGGTAVGTGINTHPDFAAQVCKILQQETQEPFFEARSHFEAQHARDALVEASGALKTLAVGLTKIANDFRLLASGPRCGISELILPAVQPGSSIMPGKVNPVICESLLQVCAQVVGADAAITYAAGLLGNLDLHVGMPVMAHNLLEAIRLLSNACHMFVERCVRGLQADQKRCESLLDQSLALATALVPVLGYDQAAEVARQAWQTGKTVRELVLEKKLLDSTALDELLDPRRMTQPQ